jgi:hypothetical protein
MRVGTVFVVASFVCFFLSIYFAMLPPIIMPDERLRVQLLALATSFFVGGTVIIVLFAAVKFSGRLFPSALQAGDPVRRNAISTQKSRGTEVHVKKKEFLNFKCMEGFSDGLSFDDYSAFNFLEEAYDGFLRVIRRERKTGLVSR